MLLISCWFSAQAQTYPASIGAFESRPQPQDQEPTSENIVSLATREQVLNSALESGGGDLENVSTLAKVRAQIAEEHADAGDFETAINYLWSSLNLNGESAARWEQFGDLLLQIDSKDAPAIAEQSYIRAALLSPLTPSIRAKLASLTLQMRKLGAAVQHFEALLLIPDAEIEWFQLGMLSSLYAATDQLDRGIRFYQGQYEERQDDRFILAQAVLMKAAGQNHKARLLLQLVETASGTPLELRRYAVELRRQLSSGGSSLPGNASAANRWHQVTE